MNCDLHTSFADTRASLAKDAHARFVVSASTFSECPQSLETGRLVLTKSTHEYGSGYRVDVVKFQATRDTFQELGLLILAVVFHPGSHRSRIMLSHPRSTIKNLVVSYSGLTARASGHKTKPDHFAFSPSGIERHPWSWGGQQWELYSMPTFALTNMKEFVASEADWAARDTVMGFGNDDANVRLADLLLNLGYSSETEVVLEGEGGFRGVGINSAEAVFEVVNDKEGIRG
jgi:hypothetical protein